MTPRREAIRRAEEQLVRIASVAAASIHTDAKGEIVAVDIVADRGRSPQKIVRDAEIVLRQENLSVDHRRIGVAALEDPDAFVSVPVEPAVPAAGPRTGGIEMAVIDVVDEPERVRVVAVHTSTRDGAFTAEVELAFGGFEGVPGRAEGPAQEALGCAALVARAALEAVRNLLRPGYEAQLRDFRVIDMGGQPLVAVTVDFGEGRRWLRLAGSCLQAGSLHDAAVHATLDALNRPLGRARYREVVELAGSDAGVEARRQSA